MVESDLRINGSILFIGFNILSFTLGKYFELRITRRQELHEYEVKTNKTEKTPSVETISSLSSSQIEEFKRRGVLVIKNFLTVDEVADARRGTEASVFRDYC